MSENFVTLTGFNKKTLAEIQVEIQAEFQEVFGNDIDLDSAGPFGQIVGIMSKREADLWDGAQELYTARNPDESTGVSLDHISAETGVTRIAAFATRVENVICFGTEGTNIATGKKIKSPNNSLTFSLVESVHISQTAVNFARLSADALVNNHEYTVTIDGIQYSYTWHTGDGDLIPFLLTELLAWGGTSYQDGADLILFSDTAFELDWTEGTGSFSNVAWGTSGIVACDVVGPNTVPANTLTVIVTPVSGWDEVNNYEAGVTGKNAESDSDLRIRRATSALTSSATDEKIRSALQNNVVGIVSASVTSNRTNAVDIYGRPPKSFEAVVQGGSDGDVAQVIWDNAPAGIEYYGNTSAVITDGQGSSQTIYFSRPESQYIWVRVSRDYYTEETYPADGDDQIKAAIVAWSTANLRPGTDLIRQRLSVPVYSVTGISDILIEIAATSTPEGTPTYAEADIPISIREIAVFDLTRITVQDLV